MEERCVRNSGQRVDQVLAGISRKQPQIAVAVVGHSVVAEEQIEPTCRTITKPDGNSALAAAMAWQSSASRERFECCKSVLEVV